MHMGLIFSLSLLLHEHVCMWMVEWVDLSVYVCTGKADRLTEKKPGQAGDGDKRVRWGHRVKTGALR